MKVTSFFIGFLSICLSCSRQMSVPSPYILNTGYSVTALRNDSVWFGKAYAFKAFVDADQPCKANRFDLSFNTDIPHSKEAYSSSAAITGCMEKCLPTQILGFSGVPLAVGRYTLVDLGSCQGHYKGQAGYMLLAGGDVIISEFRGFQGWLEVTTYSKKDEELTGKFEVALKTAEGEIARFSEGSFKVKSIAD